MAAIATAGSQWTPQFGYNDPRPELGVSSPAILQGKVLMSEIAFGGVLALQVPQILMIAGSISNAS
jgi:hypothetical protein